MKTNEQMANKKYGKKKDEGMFWKYVFPFLLVIIGVVTYLVAPSFIAFGLKISKGLLGLLVLGSLAALLSGYFILVLKVRGKTLFYCIAVTIFTMMCIWLLANHQMVFDYLDTHLGTWGSTGIILLFCLAAGIFIYAFL